MHRWRTETQKGEVTCPRAQPWSKPCVSRGLSPCAAHAPQSHARLQVRGNGRPGWLLLRSAAGRCEVGQGDGCDFCVRQFYLPCPSITDSTPHLAPRFTGSGAVLVQAPSRLRTMVWWQEAPGYVDTQDTATNWRARPPGEHPGRDGPPLGQQRGEKQGACPRGAHDLKAHHGSDPVE